MAIKKILVVDDSATDRLYLSEMLQKAGFEVSTAEDGQDCLDKINDSMPDLVLMDVVMPRLNGFQATRALSKNPATAHIPVIVCTGKGQATDFMGGAAEEFCVSANSAHPAEAYLLCQFLAENHSKNAYLAGAGMPTWKLDASVDTSTIDPLIQSIVAQVIKITILVLRFG